MELPIDHFRLLGVSPTTDGEMVLRTLQQRLDRSPDQGFTHDTLQARADLLRSSAELLSDDDRRQAYERELTSIADSTGASVAGLEIPPSREVGGLLLLMEAGQAHEAFDAAVRGLQPPQAPALGSSREADLTLLAGLACRAAAQDYRNQRRYEASARTLQQGLQLLQRMGQLPEQRRHLERELQELQPYRVLDLLSRDLSATAARSEGIALLDQMVQRRGGLDGDADPDFPASDFQPFFQQIRRFLTVQEQLDLYTRWAAAGWAPSGTLGSLALTASGFVQRKPERIQAALLQLQSGGRLGSELVMACQLLLLGQVEEAQAQFDSGADAALQAWARCQGDDPLAGLCAYCRDWLSREVLPGFRDIEAEPDLEAWYADRDVQAYIDQQDRIRGRRSAAEPQNEPPPAATDTLPPLAEAGRTAFEGFGSEFSSSFSSPFQLEPLSPLNSPSPFSTLPSTTEPTDTSDDDDLWDTAPFWSGWNLRERLRSWRGRPPEDSAPEPVAESPAPAESLSPLPPLPLPDPLPELGQPPFESLFEPLAGGLTTPLGDPLSSWPSEFSSGTGTDPASSSSNKSDSDSDAEARPRPKARRSRWPRWALPVGMAVAMGAGGGVAWFTLRPDLQRARPIPVQPSSATPVTTAKATGSHAARPPAQAPVAKPALPLTSAEPNERELQRLLEAWLQAKAAVLADKTSEHPLNQLARPLLIERLEAQQAENRSRGDVETVSASVQSLEILERSPRRIAAAVSLRYSDQRRDGSGQVVAETPSTDLRNIYVFARDGETWTLAAFRPGD